MAKDHLLHPQETLEEIKDQLFDIYREDYHQEDNSVLNERWNNTIFIFDVHPTTLRDYIKNRAEEKIPLKEYLKVAAEELDFKRQRRRLLKETKLEFADGLKKFFKVPECVSPEVLWSLDYEAFEFGAQKMDRQRNFLMECMRHEIHDLKDSLEIEDILKRKRILERKMDRRMIEETKWGRRLLEEHPELTSENLSDILFDKYAHSSTSVVRCKDGETRTVCYVPLIRYYYLPSLDRMVFHELRHVVETTPKKSGLEVFGDCKYKTLNEIRTEQNAKKDEEKLPVIFKRNKQAIQSDYEILLPVMTSIEDQVELMNLVAFHEDPSQIEETFGYKLNELLQRIHDDEKLIQKIRGK